MKKEFYSVAAGDKGIVTVDGEVVMAESCKIGPAGYAVVFRPDLLNAVGSFPELRRDEIPRVTMRGLVEFTPLELIGSDQ